jgi:hypothetical protein
VRDPLGDWNKRLPSTVARGGIVLARLPLLPQFLWFTIPNREAGQMRKAAANCTPAESGLIACTPRLAVIPLREAVIVYTY